MPRRTVVCTLALGLLIGAFQTPVPGGEPDRLERFRQLATSRLGALDLTGSDPAVEGLREIYALLDDEIVENLEAGSVFASEAFLQERLSAFSEVWGGSTFWLLNLPGGSLSVGSFQLSPGGGGNSIRVYRRVGNRAELLAVIHRDGIPHLSRMPSTRGGQGQFLAVWVGPLSPHGTPAIRIELWRQEGERVRAVWSTADLLGPDLYATAYEIRGQELAVRYEARYPGWKPGCEGQTEQEDHYRYATASDAFILIQRQVYNGWHRELHTAVERFLGALRRGDERALFALGLTPELRRLLPDRLAAEPICDIRDGPSQIVTVSATAPGDPRPWVLRFRQTRDGWRLAGAERLP